MIEKDRSSRFLHFLEVRFFFDFPTLSKVSTRSGLQITSSLRRHGLIAACSGTRSLQETRSRLNQVAGSLKDWSRATIGSMRKKIRKLEGRLRYIRGERPSEPLLEEECTVEWDLCELFEREEITARQRSRV
jgi:hypothetical protein